MEDRSDHSAKRSALPIYIISSQHFPWHPGAGLIIPPRSTARKYPARVRAAQTFRMSAGAFLCFDACEQVSKSVYGAILCGHCASMFSHAYRHGICTRGDLRTYMSNIMLIHTGGDDGTFTVYTAGFETGRNVSTRAGSTVAVCAHFRACVRLLLSHVLTCEPRKSNSGCMQRSIRRCGPQCRHASRSAPGARYKRARRRSDRIHQAGGRLLIAGVLTRRL